MLWRSARLTSAPSPTVLTVIPSARMTCVSSVMPLSGACPSVNKMTCLTLARVTARS